jgi:hypothetical protein
VTRRRGDAQSLRRAQELRGFQPRPSGFVRRSVFGTRLAWRPVSSNEGTGAMPNCPLDHEAVHEDFAAHVQARLGLENEAAAVAALGDWLSSYQPGPAALARATALPLRHRRAA